MGKVFVKGPVESPDDLLAKESQAARMGRVLADAGEGLVGMTEPTPNFGAFARKPLNFLRYLAEGRYKRKPSPLEEAMENARLRQKADETLAQQNAANEKASDIAIMEARDPANTEAQYMDPLPKLTGRGRLPFSGQRKNLKDAMNQRELDYEKIRGWGDTPSQVAARKEREAQLTQQARDNLFRQAQQDRLLGEDTDEETTANKTAEETQQAGDASNPMESMTAAGQELLQNERTGMVDDLLEDPEASPPPPQVSAGPPLELQHGQSATTQDAQHTELEKVADNMDRDGEIAQLPEGTKKEPEEPEKGTGIQMAPPDTPFGMSAPSLKDQQEDANEQQQGVNF